MSKSEQRAAQTVVFGLFLLGGYFLWRGRSRYEALDEKFDFDKSPSTRHMVGMHRRVDRELLEGWLAAQPPPEPPAASPRSASAPGSEAR